MPCFRAGACIVAVGAAVQLVALSPWGLPALAAGAVLAGAVFWLWERAGLRGRLVLSCAGLGGAGMLAGSALDTLAAGGDPHGHHATLGFAWVLMLVACSAGCWLACASRHPEEPPPGTARLAATLTGMLAGMLAASAATRAVAPGLGPAALHGLMLTGMVAGQELAILLAGSPTRRSVST